MEGIFLCSGWEWESDLPKARGDVISGEEGEIGINKALKRKLKELSLNPAFNDVVDIVYSLNANTRVIEVTLEKANKASDKARLFVGYRDDDGKWKVYCCEVSKAKDYVSRNTKTPGFAVTPKNIDTKCGSQNGWFSVLNEQTNAQKEEPSNVETV